MTWLLKHVEFVALAINGSILVAMLLRKPLEPGKILYWLGASILTIGLIKMRG